MSCVDATYMQVSIEVLRGHLIPQKTQVPEGWELHHVGPTKEQQVLTAA